MRLFGYSIREQGELMVGVMLADNVDDAKAIIEKSLHLETVDDSDVTKLTFDEDGLSEIYYGT